MKRKPIYLLLLVALILVPALVFLCDKVIVPKEIVGQVKPLKFKPLKMMTVTKDCLVFHVPVLYQDIPSPKPPMPKWLRRLTGDYREYSAECYADSIREQINLSWMWEWIHREPTLPGFMQFLEEKYK